MCGKDKRLAKPAPISLCGRPLPWVASATHLGHELHESGEMTYDSKVKRAQYIGRSVEVRDSFGFASPPEVLTALNLYCSSYYGCLAGWDLGSAASAAYYSAQTVGVKLAWGVPRATHTYFVQQCLAPGPPAPGPRSWRGLPASSAGCGTLPARRSAQWLYCAAGTCGPLLDPTSG